MFCIGPHLSTTGGFLKMGQTAVEIGANTFQYFTRNPRGGRAKAIDPADAAALIALMEEEQFGPVMAHAPYTLNPCSDKPSVREFAMQTMADDLVRTEYLPGNFYNFHPGSHVGQGIEAGITLIAKQLNTLLTSDLTTTVLLETMTGKGSEIGGSFEELREICDRVSLADKLGICLDTCHIHDAGYDIVGDLDGVLTEFDRVIGLERLQAIHLNDSKNLRGAKKDRHAVIGGGELGLAALTRVINHPVLRVLPFFLETPNELPGYAEEIRLLRQLRV
ncbi:MAG: deoxyribonuclease IV [Oscillospiraceae bacterium]|nr:deoxyribonuclease IV [Oscillospiraceae bacterium]